MDGQKISREIQGFDQLEFLLDLRFRLFRRAIRVAAHHALIGEASETFLGRFALADFIGILIREFAQAEATPRSDFYRALQRGRMITKHTRHISVPFETTFSIGERARADLIDGDMFAHAGEHIGELATFAVMHQWITYSHHRRGGFERKPRARGEVGLIRPIVAWGGTEEDVGRVTTLHFLDVSGGFAQGTVWQGDEDHASAAL